MIISREFVGLIAGRSAQSIEQAELGNRTSILICNDFRLAILSFQSDYHSSHRVVGPHTDVVKPMEL